VRHLSDRIIFIKKEISKKVSHMQEYQQLQFQERYKIFQGKKQGKSDRAIAREVGRHHSTVSREIGRNSDLKGFYYYPEDAHANSKKRKAKHGSKITRNNDLNQHVIAGLQKSWPPVAIAGDWNRKNPEKPVTDETIYRFVYRPENKRLELHKLLPRRKSKRGIVRKTKSVGGIMNRISIHERPESINQRAEIGDFEADLIFYKGSQSANVFTAIDRKTRFALMIKNESKHSEEILEKASVKLGGIAKSITFDNGKEFASHFKLTEKHGIKTYFCDPGSPWQKGGIEHFNGMTRRFIPFEVPYYTVTQEELDAVAYSINHMPRQSLGFLTACEAFNRGFQSEINQCCTS
jgi:IS30 family transposase